MRVKMTKLIFICQIAETILKVIKFQREANSKGTLLGLEVVTLAQDIDEAQLAQNLNQVFKKLEYKHNPVIVSLSRNYATCRYLKVPTQVPGEIEKIISLQAATYLPYPANELITGFQVVSTDKEGYAHINLVIVHKDIIERYIRIFKELKITNPSIVLSSYGACKLYSFINPKEQGSSMLIDIDSHQVELAITLQNRLSFSRFFKLDRLQSNWQQVFIDEINKTNSAYLKEVSQDTPSKIIILGGCTIPQETLDALGKQIALPLEFLAYDKKIIISKDVSQDVLNSDNSFASLIGLGLEKADESLNLLPQDIRQRYRNILQRKQDLRLILFVCGIISIFGMAIAKNFDNKAQHLKRLKSELDRIAKEAKSLEEIENRFKLLENQSLKKPSSLDILYELHQVIPANVSLTNLSFEEDNQAVLHGQTPEFNAVFVFVSQLKKSGVFKTFNIEVRHATKKKIQAGEIVDFEIVCLKSK